MFTDEEMILKMSIIVCVCMMSPIILAVPLLQTPSFQDVVDAVQGEKIARNSDDIEALKRQVASMDSKLNYMLGGIAGIYGILAIVGTINAVILKKSRA